VGDILVIPPISRLPHCLALRAKKAKKGKKHGGKLRRANKEKLEEEMKRRNTKREQQPNCDLEKLLDKIERVATAAAKIYRGIEAILTKWRKAK
jgi:hypothetical protein